MPVTPALLEIRRVAYGQPDAMRLIDEVQAEYVQRYGGPDDTPLDHAMFEPPLGSFYVAYDDGEPVATGAWRRTSVRALGATDAAEIKRMYVVPSARGAGVARAVLAHLEATAIAAGIDVLVLETGMKQPEAIALYTSSAYVPVPGFGYYKDQPLSRCFGKRLALGVLERGEV
ncbi:GNAT superfamily N-acetyltransferase [Nocardioides ginsengisegetis]|uniref:GNAT superfamily N-acetyltransferase n=1 Tax=Nocardioides ginsengisegetis TaxID=661491 RepID=A0A7W3J2D9_9ACTN|nr:GNAT family N-acetyltransferase [Nocardioides ginsengisegetis]MBA8805043.1 GNAT superfamily N-acetyltransferase [Nocardioides ginsengisegetis]